MQSKPEKDDVLSEEELQVLAENFVINNTFSQNNNLFDFDFNASSQTDRIETYRKLSHFSEVENAIEEIVNESIVETQEGDIPIQLNLNEMSPIYDSLRDYADYYFDRAVKELHLRNYIYELFRTFYIDGYLVIGIVRDPEELGKDGKNKIKELMFLDPSYLTQNKNEFKYTPPADMNNTFNFSRKEFKFPKDDIIFTISGLVDTRSKIIMSCLQKALKPANLLYMIEDSATVYSLVRSPSRRIWNVNFGSISNTTAKEERIMKKLAASNRSKITYDPVKGNLKGSDSTFMSLTEDIYLPKTNGGPEVNVNVLNGDVSALKAFEPLILYFKEKLYESLNVPFTRMKKSAVFGGQEGFDISREEYKFSRFIIKLRRKFSEMITIIMYKLMISDAIISEDDETYEMIKELVFYKYTDNNVYKERQNNIINDEKLSVLAKASSFIGTLYSEYYVYKKMLNMTDEEIEDMRNQMNAENETFLLKQQREASLIPQTPDQGNQEPPAAL